MNEDEYGIEDDDTDFLAAATQAETFIPGTNFEPSPRPAKRRRLSKGPEHTNLGQLIDPEFSESDHLPDDTQGLESGTALASQEAQSREPDEDQGYYFPEELPGGDKTAKQSKYKIHVPQDGGEFEHQIVTQTQVGLDLSASQFRGPVWKRPKASVGNLPVFAAVRGEGKTPVLSGLRQTTINGFGRATVTTSGPHSASIDSDAALAARLQASEDAIQSRNPGRTPGKSASVDSDAAFAARLQAREDAIQSRNPGRAPGNVSTNLPEFDLSHELADLPSDAFSSSSPERATSKMPIILSSQVSPQARPQNPQRHGPALTQRTISGNTARPERQSSPTKHAWPLKSREEPPTHHQLDDKAMETWVYPTNLGTCRDYQYSIVARSLFHNTLVALPTGLGKTFIAATVMLNYYRWTKNAQIIFMAPTKPLIAQQMEACYKIAGIPQRDTSLMTGETNPALRAEDWLEKRVFFMTPQTVVNDLKTGISDPKKVVLLVVDEAHKATGNYAYTEVVRFLRRFNSSFRIHALTATPGATVEAVQGVIDALGIARVEVRTEQSLDIRPYTHEKHTDTEIFDYSEEQQHIMELMSKALRPTLDKLCTQNGYWSRDPMALTAFGLTKARQKWMSSDAGRRAPQSVKAMINTCFTVLSQLAHGIGLLKFHGIGPFFSCITKFQRKVDSGESKGKTVAGIVQSEHFVKTVSTIRTWTNNPDFIGHPKLEYLREVVLNHFLDAGEGKQGSDVPPSSTRVMIFVSYRDSTEDVCRVLKRSEPMIRPHVFVGKMNSEGSEGMDQKKQSAVIKDFRSGKFNTLVATSIGEEGLDIGDVDLIVCYDASSSPIRMLQRIGRTGRKRVGRVVLLLMRNKEENDYAKAQDNYLHIQKTIADASSYNYRDDQSPRILPKETRPVVDKCTIDIPVENSQPIDLNEKKRKPRGQGKGKPKRPPKKFHMPDGVWTGFTQASKMAASDDESEANVVDEEAGPKKAKRALTKAKKVAAKPASESVPLPPLRDVLLTDIQQRELDRNYARTGGGKDLIIHAPDPGRFPESVKHLSATKYLGHGRAARVVEKALRALSNVTTEQINAMKAGFDESVLLEVGDEAGTRLVNPSGHDHSGVDPVKTTVSMGTESATGLSKTGAIPTSGHAQMKTKTKATSSKKAPRRRPTAHTASARDDEMDDLVSSRPTKQPAKPAAKRRKSRASSGSMAAEGQESSPEPTPADMRIATQGIDLGSRDTSGEDEGEESDSEMADFVVRSDQPIEMATSSPAALCDSSPPRPQYKRRQKRGLTRAGDLSDVGSDGSARDHTPKQKEKRPVAVICSDDDESQVSIITPGRQSGNDDEGFGTEAASTTATSHARRGFRRRLVDMSDSDE